MDKPNVLIIADKRDTETLGIGSQSKWWNIYWKMIKYPELYKRISEIQGAITRNNIDFVLFSRNDQVANRSSIGEITKKLKIGYCSFSGIDREQRLEEMKACFEDFMECSRRLDFEITTRKDVSGKGSNGRGSYSLIFDTEQLGGVRYGLPRILNLLNKYHVRATFFITNVVKKVYPNILDGIQQQGHEVGIHGRWHEYLSRYNIRRQSVLIKSMVEDFGCQIDGANFMGRMNADTVNAMIENKLRYFVYPMINCYRFLNYPKLPTNPFLVSSKDGRIWMLPVSVETYNRPWLSIRNMIDSAFSCSSSTKHVTILLHPFRDGNRGHIVNTERLLRYLQKERGLTGVTVKNFLAKQEKRANICKIDVNRTDSLGSNWSIPKTKEDLMFIIPESLIMFWRMVKRHSAAW